MFFLRFCDVCRDKDVVCFRRVVVIFCSDCESGNKSVFEIFKEKLEVDIEDFEFVFLFVLLDCSYVGKSMKVAFLNWWLGCKGECINLVLVWILRNRLNKEIKYIFRKFIFKNDYVKNKDR